MSDSVMGLSEFSLVAYWRGLKKDQKESMAVAVNSSVGISLIQGGY